MPAANHTEERHRLHSMGNRKDYLTATVLAGYSDEFYTPASIVTKLGKFDLDPCAGPKSHATLNIRFPDNGLEAKWKGRVWMNPPYLEIHQWILKFQEHANGIALFNARCETGWFQRLAAAADALLFVKGRIQFERPDKKPGHGPVGSVMIAYGKRNALALSKSGIPGILTFPKQPS